jgi:hypothetical protein
MIADIVSVGPDTTTVMVLVMGIGIIAAIAVIVYLLLRKIRKKANA